MKLFSKSELKSAALGAGGLFAGEYAGRQVASLMPDSAALNGQVGNLLTATAMFALGHMLGAQGGAVGAVGRGVQVGAAAHGIGGLAMAANLPQRAEFWPDHNLEVW